MNIPQIIQEKCPIWSARLQKETPYQIRYDAGERGTYLGNFSCCIVGEAHGFSLEYNTIRSSSYCRECMRIADDLCTAATVRIPLEERKSKSEIGYEGYDSHTFQKLLNKFADHLLAAHVEQKTIPIEQVLLQEMV